MRLRNILFGLAAATMIFTATAHGVFAKAVAYKNVSGVTVHVPTQKYHYGATAQCKDGSYSYSLHRSGTCSGHKGVKIWF